jgi:gliding motility-associated-like protein
MDSSVVLTCVGVGVPLHAYVSPGGIPVSYTWSPGAFLSASTISNPVVTPGLAGDITYTVTINPGLNPACASVDTVHVHAIAPFVLNNRDTAICLGRFVFGSITGSAEMDYRWSPAAGVSDTTLQNPVLTPTVSTSYIVRGSYAHCPDQFASFYLEVDTLAHPVSIIDTICLGMSDTFNVAVPGPGTGSNYYHYQWIPSADVSNDTLPNVVIIPVTMGTHVYSVVVNPHALNCSTTGTVNIFVLPNSISVSPHDTMICKGKMVQAVGAGDPLFSYQWIPTAGIGVSNVLNALITPDTSATYVVTASFGRCPDMQDSIRLDVQPNPSVYIGGNRLFCAFDTLHINAQVDPAWYGSYAYSWTPAAGLDNTTAQTVVYSGTSTTDVYVTVTTPAGCQGKDSAHITVYPGNFAAMVPDHLDFCPHQSASLPVTTALAGVSYKWFPARYLSDSTSGNPVVSPEVTQVYTIVATTANGCRDTLNFTAIVYPAALISLPDSVVLYPGERYQLEPYTNCNSFVWAPPVGLDNPYISNPVASPGVSTRYRVEGTTINGCKTADSIDVIVDPGAVITVPNAFVPGSEVNNEFKIIRKGIATLNYFRIFNRWGNLLFETNNIDQGWNGSFKSEPQPFGVYVYEIQAVSVTGQIFTKKGNVTLLR